MEHAVVQNQTFTYGVLDLPTDGSRGFGATALVERGGVNLGELRGQLEEIRDHFSGIAEEDPTPGKFALQSLEVALTIGAEGAVWFVAKGSAEASIKLTFGRGSAS